MTATGEGLTPTQASVLTLIATRGPLGLTELAEREGVNPTMLSRVVQALVRLDLIDRVSDPFDQRAIQVNVTENGRGTHERIRASRTQVIDRCLSKLSEKDRTAIIEVIPSLELLADELRASHAVR